MKKKKKRIPAQKKFPQAGLQWKDWEVISKGRELDFRIPTGAHLSVPVSTDCSCSQLRLVCSSFPLAVGDAYATQHRTPDHQRCCLPQNNLSALLFAAAAFPAPSPVLSGVFVHDATA